MDRPERPDAFAVAVGAGILTLYIMLLSSNIPITWDEGEYINRAERVLAWFDNISEKGFTSLSHSSRQESFVFTTQKEGHPALFGIVIASGHYMTRPLLDMLTSYRFGTMAVFAMAVGCTYYRVAKREGWQVALATIVALLTIPRLFGDQHFATGDGQVTSWWLISVLTFPMGQGIWRSYAAWGVCLGCCMATKFTGWLIVLPIALWYTWFGRSPGLLVRLLCAAIIALVVFVLLNPPIWSEPFQGVVEFVSRNVTRSRRINVTTYFLGDHYNARHTLPWYNAIFWTAITIPVGSLGLGLFGIVGCIRSESLWIVPDRWRAWIILNWLSLIVVRSLPGAPPHDGIRLFLPAFAMFAVLVGFGCGDVLRLVKRGRLSATRGYTIISLCLASSALATVWYAPQYLSHYNLLIGGLRGASYCGMEPTYWWDGLDEDVYRWIDENVPKDEMVGCSFVPNLDKLVKWEPRARFVIAPPSATRWYMIYLRPSSMTAVDWRVRAKYSPVYKKTIRNPRLGFGPYCLDVPLIEIYNLQPHRPSLRALPGVQNGDNGNGQHPSDMASGPCKTST